MSSFLEIMGQLELRDVPEVWLTLSRLELSLVMSSGHCGLKIAIPEDKRIVAEFDLADECSGCVRIEEDLAALSTHTLQAAYLIVGWDNIREKQFFGPPDAVAALRSQLALEQIEELKNELRVEDIPQAIALLQANP